MDVEETDTVEIPIQIGIVHMVDPDRRKSTSSSLRRVLRICFFD